MVDWASNILLWCIILVIPVLFLLLHRRRSGSVRLPPGPPGWPVFGNMFDLGAMPHETLAGLRHKYGDVVWLNLGAIKTTVVQSSKAAAELFKNQDLCFSDRTITETMRAQGYHESSLALAPYGPHWRSLRRLMTMEMLVTKRINETAGVRGKCVDDMLSWIEEEARGVGGEGRGIQVAHFVFLASFNMLGNLMLSCDLLHPGSKEGSEFFEVMVRVMEWPGHPNSADFFPWLRWMDPQGLRKKAERDLGIAMKIASGFVQERIKRGPAAEDHKKDFLDVLLDFQGSGKNEPPQISDKDLNIIILEIFMAGSETTSSTVEWALTELLRPSRMHGEGCREGNIQVAPSNPISGSSEGSSRHQFHGISIFPKTHNCFVNVWAIGREAELWEEPSSFKPERFLDLKHIDYKGQHFELIPFGAGRRMCAGVPLAHRMVHLVLGSLVYHFDWQLDSSITLETMDMRENLAMVMRKLEPLKALPKKVSL
ncbi:Cytochrome P450 76A2 [Vitis vinifera]|uniref:Cytochrome P450 76A2 n=1 Tax=Vitis vinifera TaxID=29760 RepID=A0A438EKD3_VITVI|nr:Cytochrome P450 76A2 [Vitis vinifera]